MGKKTGVLPQVSFCILFALSLRPRHGYELMQQIKFDTGGRINLGAGALYGSIKRLSDDNMIEIMPFEGDVRRTYYRLTKKGWDTLEGELDYFRITLQLARDRHLLGF